MCLFPFIHENMTKNSTYNPKLAKYSSKNHQYEKFRKKKNAVYDIS